jgi:hypothetical protein
MVIVLTLSVVDCGFEPRSGQIKNYKIHICRFSAKHTALRRNSNDWLDRNQDNVLDRTIRRVVSVSHLPLTILIVGIGPADFFLMVRIHFMY